MTIDELIEKLQLVKREHDNLEVRVYAYDSLAAPGYPDVLWVEKSDEFNPYVLLAAE